MSPTARGRYATCEIQSSVRRKHGNQHRKRHERVVVRANQVHGSHLTPPGCYAEQLPLSISSASLSILRVRSVSMVIGASLAMLSTLRREILPTAVEVNNFH